MQRQGIKDGKKDRAKAWEELNKMYIDPAARWTKVIADEVGLLETPKAGDVSLPKLSAPTMPKLSAPNLSAPDKKQVVKSGVQGFAGLVGSLPTKKPVKKAAPKKAVDKVVPAVANVAFPAVVLTLPAALLAFTFYEKYVQ